MAAKKAQVVISPSPSDSPSPSPSAYERELQREQDNQPLAEEETIIDIENQEVVVTDKDEIDLKYRSSNKEVHIEKPIIEKSPERFLDMNLGEVKLYAKFQMIEGGVIRKRITTKNQLVTFIGKMKASNTARRKMLFKGIVEEK